MNLLYPDYNSENEDVILNDPKDEQERKRPPRVAENALGYSNKLFISVGLII